LFSRGVRTVFVVPFDARRPLVAAEPAELSAPLDRGGYR